MKNKLLFTTISLSLLFLAACAPAQNTTQAATSDVSVSKTETPLPPTIEPTVMSTVTLTAMPTSTSIPNVTTIEEAIPLFDYDIDAPLNIVEKNPVRDVDGVQIYDIVFYGPENRSVRAYLIVPPGEGPFPGIVYAHWLGDIYSNRDEFLQEAISMGGQGYASILVEQVFPWRQKPKSIERDRVAIIKQVISIRRCVDVLLDRTYVNVDPERIIYVGHDYGAMYGAIILGFDERFSAAVLMTPTTRFANWNAGFWVLSDNATDYRAALKPFDPLEYIARINPIPLLLQYGERDVYVSIDTANEFTEAVNVPVDVKFYDAIHKLDQQAQDDRIVWLLDLFRP